ncbi:MAG: TetR/AcrR family transcriptional regulator [Micromonosporaceae bacterium]
MSAPRTARERARTELVAEIKRVARRHLAEHGAAALSMRAISRDLGMVSSAIYRYFPSRDHLLTALIVDSYDAVGAAAEQADAAQPAEAYHERWLATCRAVRAWALTHPHEHALLYGSPVPGYRAPEDTIAPASRVGVVLSRLFSEAYAAGALRPPGTPPVPTALWPDTERLRATVMPGLPDELVMLGILVWTHLFGAISFELFGHYHNVIDAADDGFDHTMTTLASLIGLPPG